MSELSPSSQIKTDKLPKTKGEIENDLKTMNEFLSSKDDRNLSQQDSQQILEQSFIPMIKRMNIGIDTDALKCQKDTKIQNLKSIMIIIGSMNRKIQIFNILTNEKNYTFDEISLSSEEIEKKKILIMENKKRLIDEYMKIEKDLNQSLLQLFLFL